MCVWVTVCVLGVGWWGCGLVTVVCATLHVSNSKSYAMTQACCALKPGAMVTDMLAPAPCVTLSIIPACFYIMVFD